MDGALGTTCARKLPQKMYVRRCICVQPYTNINSLVLVRQRTRIPTFPRGQTKESWWFPCPPPHPPLKWTCMAADCRAVTRSSGFQCNGIHLREHHPVQVRSSGKWITYVSEVHERTCIAHTRRAHLACSLPPLQLKARAGDKSHKKVILVVYY